MTGLSVLAAAREHAGRVAVTDGEHSLSYADLAERVRERMRGLAAIASDARRERSLVAVLSGEGSEALSTIELLLALFELGLPFIPVHARAMPAEREALLGALPVAWQVEPSADGQRLVPREFHESAFASQLLAEAPALCALATSGSTGAPRVALLRRSAFEAAAAASAAHLGWRADERWLLCLPLAHVGGLSVLTRCLIARQSVALLGSAAGHSSSERLGAAIARTRPGLISMVPAQLDGLLELGPSFELPSSVRVILTGGAASSPRLLDRCTERGWPVLTSYGLTEACSQVATQRPGTVRHAGSGVGVPLPGVELRVESGVIVIAGPTLASGYLGQGVEQRFGPEGYRTRDLGCVDAAGELHVLGRVDDVIISGGENVMPWEVEAALASCPGVQEVCVFAQPDARFGDVVAAGLRTRAPDPRALLAAVERHAREQLAPFKRPRYYVCVEQFSLGKNGKLDRQATIAELRQRLERIS